MEQKQKRRTPIQTLQFSIIGIANAVVDIGSLNLLLFFFPTDERWMLSILNTIAYSLAVANSYIWNSLITFRHAAEGSAKQRIGFVLQGGFSLLINTGIFLAANEILKLFGIPDWLRYNLAKGIAMFSSFTASFFMIKYLVFKDFKQKK
ncbi:GtrA family protein [Planomicrobium sp. CPCC 101079]|uniref:GtrA family protein n=1 Tax=Planomicrobium sp. CPCC 101079 TaxID=2599618 RepID=UPI0011B3C630|nr:GtrA family protein [Planomicrobium sp. CPCC 101079]TWT01569.1 GtrA family protein [Planomicrobium sp. CPCC 101079]